MSRIAIVAAKRTPMGAFMGSLSTVPAPKLASTAITAAMEQSKVPNDEINEALFGNVVGAGIGQAPTRQAVLGAGLPESIPCTTVNKVCGSGMKCLMMGSDSIRAGSNDVVLVGGMENMSMTPYVLDRSGPKMGHKQMKDSMINDGLWDPYDNVHMGNCGEICAKEYKFSREEQDEYALESLRRAKAAQESGVFNWEIAPVSVPGRGGKVTVVDTDESPGQAKADKIPGLRPAFEKTGTLTAANSSSINDGASCLVLASEEKVASLGLSPVAWVTGYAQHAQTPKYFTTAPAPAMEKLLKNLNLTVKDIDLWEINEAFAIVTMAAMRDMNIAHDQVNIHGGATSLGHPIGSSGSRIIVSLINALRAQGKQRGIASLCIGGGEATAVCVEMA
eukprot:TRINITY_DN595_c17_g1_i1.p1 TRINITY_DN595_c17_g1~~TRINITY_DN595_c17_g1_i1.p1  ORF type:complete len:411 (+),score=106.50 TRINITY_DN595_c17_g1_i1:63-1235(+)